MLLGSVRLGSQFHRCPKPVRREMEIVNMTCEAVHLMLRRAPQKCDVGPEQQEWRPADREGGIGVGTDRGPEMADPVDGSNGSLEQRLTWA